MLFSATRLFQFIDENCPLEFICIYNYFNGLKKKNIYTEFGHDILVFIHDCILILTKWLF